jgi:type III restriction enzyme
MTAIAGVLAGHYGLTAEELDFVVNCDIKRALRLAGLLVHEGLNEDADEQLRETFLKKLKELRDKYAKTVAEWSNVVREGGEIEVDIRKIAIGGMTITGTNSARVLLSEENIDQLFDAVGRMLAAGEGLHRTYWKRFHDKEAPNQAKIELVAIMRQPETMVAMEKLGRDEFDAAWTKHKTAIQKLPASIRSRFQALIHASGKAATQDWELPDQIVEKKDGLAWDSHLYQEAGGNFFADLNTLEKEVLKAEMAKKDFVCWLRNLDRRDWALCVPYEMAGEIRGFYPDFVIVRRNGKALVVDIVEPHDPGKTDTIPKAIGLAKFADEHGEEFGRMIIASKQGERWLVADLSNKTTRERIKTLQPANTIDCLYEA